MKINPTRLLFYVFFAIAFVGFCDRIYPIAPTYLYSKIWMVFGARLEALFYITLIAFAIPTTWVGLKLVAKIFLIWRFLGFVWFCYIQFTADHILKDALWSAGFRGSGAIVESVIFASIQDGAVLAVPVVVAYSLWMKSQAIRSTNDIHNH